MCFDAWVNKVIASVGVLVVMAVAMPPNADAALIACVQTVTGSVRIVSNLNECRLGETALSLSTPTLPSDSAKEIGSHSYRTCDPPLELVALPVVISSSSIILAFGDAELAPANTNGSIPPTVVVTADLLSGSVQVASRGGGRLNVGTAGASMVSGPLLDANGHIYKAAPGRYTLRLSLHYQLGPCDQSVFTQLPSQLSFVTQEAS
jgi:hypothetical protein